MVRCWLVTRSWYSYAWPRSKYRPMKNVSTYHSRRPHLLTLKMLPTRPTWPRSTANTPIWQVTLDSSSTVVLIEPSRTSRWAPGQARPSPFSTERIVKYIANSAAKNISSEDSQMIVPTLTRLGRLAGVRGTASPTDAVATTSLLRQPVGVGQPPPQLGGIFFVSARGSLHPNYLGERRQNPIAAGQPQSNVTICPQPPPKPTKACDNPTHPPPPPSPPPRPPPPTPPGPQIGPHPKTSPAPPVPRATAPRAPRAWSPTDLESY